jgi:hypothetical protein
LLSSAPRSGSGRESLAMEGKGEIFVNEAHESGFDVLLFQIGHHGLMELLAVAALKVTEFHDGERCSSVTKAGFSF